MKSLQKQSPRRASKFESLVREAQKVGEELKRSAANAGKLNSAYRKVVRALIEEAQRGGHDIEVCHGCEGTEQSPVKDAAGVLLSLIGGAEGKPNVVVLDPVFCAALIPGCAPIYRRPGKICITIGCRFGDVPVTCYAVCFTLH
jgi:hypothetical protein